MPRHARARARRAGRPPRPPRLQHTPPVYAYASVPRLFPGRTIVCVGSGPSLAERDLLRCRDAGLPVVVVNNAYQLAPWADVLYAADAKWWKWQMGVPDEELPARKYSVSRRAIEYRPSIEILGWNGQSGLSTDPRMVRLGGHSGYQAINIAYHLGAARIVLLGYDMQAGVDARQHFFGDHPDKTHVKYLYHIGTFNSMRLALGACDPPIPLVNATRQTAIPPSIVPRVALEHLL